jgi:hypothetical protein
MPYLSSILRQSGARVGVVHRLEARRPDAPLEVEDVRVVRPALEPAAVPQGPPAAPAGPAPPPATPVREAADHPPAPSAPRPQPAPSSPPPALAAREPARGVPRRVLTDLMAAQEESTPAPPQAARPGVAADAGAEPPRLRISPRPATPADDDLPAEQQVLRQVAEVVAWVAAGAEADVLAPVAPVIVVAPPPTGALARPVAATTAEAVAEAGLAGVDTGEVFVSVGAIEVTVEAPEPSAAPPVLAVPVARSAPAAPEPPASGIGLTRHYLRS